MSAISERSVACEKTGLIKDGKAFSEVSPTAKSPLHLNLEENKRRKGDLLPTLVTPKAEVIFQTICVFTENNT